MDEQPTLSPLRLLDWERQNEGQWSAYVVGDKGVGYNCRVIYDSKLACFLAQLMVAGTMVHTSEHFSLDSAQCEAYEALLRGMRLRER